MVAAEDSGILFEKIRSSYYLDVSRKAFPTIVAAFIPKVDHFVTNDDDDLKYYNVNETHKILAKLAFSLHCLSESEYLWKLDQQGRQFFDEVIGDDR